MLFPEQLYQLSQRDQQVTWLDPLLTRTSSTAAALNVTATYSPPPDRALILTNVSGYFEAGGAQTVDIAELTVSRGGQVITLDGFNFAATNPEWLSWQGEIILPPGWVLSASASFSAAVAANKTQLDVCGILIPIGNVQRL